MWTVSRSTFIIPLFITTFVYAPTTDHTIIHSCWIKYSNNNPISHANRSPLPLCQPHRLGLGSEKYLLSQMLYREYFFWINRVLSSCSQVRWESIFLFSQKKLHVFFLEIFCTVFTQLCCMYFAKHMCFCHMRRCSSAKFQQKSRLPRSILQCSTFKTAQFYYSEKLIKRIHQIWHHTLFQPLCAW